MVAELLSVLGPAAGIAVLAVMALAPSLLDLPQRRRVSAGVAVPEPRTASDGLVSAG